MKRVLAVLRLLFAHSWPIGLMSGAAVLSSALGVFFGPEFVIGNIFAVFSILWASTAFRQFVSNGRLSMLPGFRAHAVAGLFLVALAVGVAAALSAVLKLDASAAVSPVRAGFLAFALVSAYCLLNQWACTTRAPVLLQLLFVLLVMRYVATGNVFASTLGENAWMLALAALLGWGLLLARAQRAARFAGPHPLVRVENTSGINAPQWTLGAMFGVGPLNLGRPVHSAGTLMRGGNDGWVNRIGASLFWVLGFAFLWMLWMYALPAAAGWRGRYGDPVILFLTVSFAATAAQAPLRFFDWPARLRYVWLRTPGDRAVLWQMLERTIATEAATVAAITAVVSAAFFLAAGTALGLLFTYVLGSTVAMLIGAYGAMGMRMSGASVSAVNVCAVLGVLPVLWIVMAAGPEPAVLDSLLFVIGVLAVISRYVVRRMFMRMDWCAVKPWRTPFARARP